MDFNLSATRPTSVGFATPLSRRSRVPPRPTWAGLRPRLARSRTCGDHTRCWPGPCTCFNEMTKERAAWPHFQVVDIAVQGLRQSKDELRQAARPPLQVPENSLRHSYGELRLDRPPAKRKEGRGARRPTSPLSPAAREAGEFEGRGATLHDGRSSSSFETRLCAALLTMRRIGKRAFCALRRAGDGEIGAEARRLPGVEVAQHVLELRPRDVEAEAAEHEMARRIGRSSAAITASAARAGSPACVPL